MSGTHSFILLKYPWIHQCSHFSRRKLNCLVLGSVFRDGHPSGPNSPGLDPAQSPYGDASSDDEDHYHDREEEEVSSADTQKAGDETNHELPEPALGSDRDGQAPSDQNPQDGPLARDIQRRTTFYDYATEKQISFADAKLFYQRSQMDAQRGGDGGWASQTSLPGSPIMVMPGTDDADIQRIGSLRSIQSGLMMPQR